MKIQMAFRLVPSSTWQPTLSHIQCFHCDAANFTSCYEIGMMKPCAENQGACMIEIRKRDGVMESVCMGCKQIAACKANRG